MTKTLRKSFVCGRNLREFPRAKDRQVALVPPQATGMALGLTQLANVLATFSVDPRKRNFFKFKGVLSRQLFEVVSIYADLIGNLSIIPEVSVRRLVLRSPEIPQI